MESYPIEDEPIETASATTSRDNQSPTLYVLVVAAATIVITSLVFSLLVGCVSIATDWAFEEAESYPRGYSETSPYDDWDWEDFEEEFRYEDYDELDEELYRLLGDEDRHESHA